MQVKTQIKVIQHMIMLTVVAVVFSVGYGVYLVIGSAPQQERATNSLKTYTDALGVKVTKHTCNKDSDGDGYASCSYRGLSNTIVPIECDSAWVFNTNTCKNPKNIFNQ